MRVLHIFNEIKYSGGEIMYANAASIFQKEGYELLALSTGKEIGEYSIKFIENNIKVFHKPIPPSIFHLFKWLKYFLYINKLLIFERIDIVHIHRADVFWFFSFCAFIRKKKKVYTVHNVFKNRKITWLKAYFERLISRKIFNLTFQTIGESVYFNELNYYKNPSIRVNNWFNSNCFYPPVSEDEKSKLRETLEIPVEKFVIISVGGCSAIKNHHDIIKALAVVSKLFPVLYLHLGSGETECEEKELASQLNLSESIRFVGNKENVRDYLIAADIFVMTSHFEGLTIAGIEAMACGLPCILYNVPGLKDLIKNDDNGFLIEKSFNVLASRITDLYHNNTLKIKMGNNALKFAENNFSMEISVHKIINIYNSK